MGQRKNGVKAEGAALVKGEFILLRIGQRHEMHTPKGAPLAPTV